MKLKLTEIYDLNFELNGMNVKTADGKVHQQSVGLLGQKMSMKVKLYLQRLSKIVIEEAELLEKSMKELFDKYAEGEEGKKIVPADKLEEFNKEQQDVLNIEKDIDVQNLWSGEITIDSLASIETNENYPIFLKLIDK
jgi:hypothetical protein